MKWLAKDRYNLIDVAGITLIVKFLLDKSFVAALITLITASFLSAVVIFISKIGDKA